MLQSDNKACITYFRTTMAYLQYCCRWLTLWFVMDLSIIEFSLWYFACVDGPYWKFLSVKNNVFGMQEESAIEQEATCKPFKMFLCTPSVTWPASSWLTYIFVCIFVALIFENLHFRFVYHFITSRTMIRDILSRTSNYASVQCCYKSHFFLQYFIHASNLFTSDS